MLSMFGDILIDCTYIHTSDWSGSCSEEGPLFEGVSLRALYVDPYWRREREHFFGFGIRGDARTSSPGFANWPSPPRFGHFEPEWDTK